VIPASTPLAQVPVGCRVPDGDQEPLAQREYGESAHSYRSPFQRDRARIIHARAFRRLAGKTQVFTDRFSDHFRSRLTHTMEVAQIARTIAGAFGLNEDLTESLALVHDIGHPPFGHAGEHALDKALQKHGLRFDHNLHALRIVEYFEQRYASFRGLNLTLGVREGIVKHSHDYTLDEHPELAAYFLDKRPPLEAQLIDLADEIAYLTADLDDGMEAGILTLDHVRSHITIFEHYYELSRDRFPHAEEKLLFNEALKRVLNALVGDLIEETLRRVTADGITSLTGVRNAPTRLCAFSPSMEAQRMEAKRYLYENLYHSEDLLRDQRQAAEIIQELFQAWVADPTLMPRGHEIHVEEHGVPRFVADYIAGMTDKFILSQYSQWLANKSAQ
jgi:dGTPase